VKQTYGQLWDGYVAESFPKLQQSSERKLTYPGEEWGSEASWKEIFAKLFEPSDVANWNYAIEIGGGGGKYTERVLRANDHVKVWGFDVSRNFLEATGARLHEYVDADRLFLNEIDPVHPDAIYRMLEERGVVRQVDAMFSIDAMVHVDIQYLLVYWINAALTLRPGGRILMTIADPTSHSGFQKIRRDIRKFYKFQGRMCPKFEYQSEEIARAILTRLGFDIVCLEQWSYFEGRPARDLYLIAELARPEQADRFRETVRADPNAEGPPSDRESPETFSEMWDRCLDSIVSGAASGPRPTPTAAFDALVGAETARGWTRAIEIGGGDVELTRHVLQAAPGLTLMETAISRRAAEVYGEGLSDLGEGRVRVGQVDPVNPDGILRRCEKEGWVRQVDAVFSLNVLTHIDLQYGFTYLVNAALVLKKGGVLLINVGDASTEAGLNKLFADIRRYFPFQGQACPRFEYQSPNMMRSLLTGLGFEVRTLEHFAPSPSLQRDLYIVATLERPEQADDFRTDISIGLPIPMLAAGEDARPLKRIPEMSEASGGDQEIARVLGQAYWRQLFIQANPDISKEEIKAKLNESWGGARRDYTRLGHMVLRQLKNMGYAIEKKGGTGEA
jgi:cyclopropane fatty-acyl-phospholipid synthase-like methyltransferase